MKGIILAAGLGTRLHPLTALLPKPAVPFLNRPFVHYALQLLQRAQITQIVVNLHYLPEAIELAVAQTVNDRENKDQNTPQITFSREHTILGTAGALGQVREFLEDNTFIVCNGKIYFEDDLQEAIQFHRDTNSTVTLVLVPYSKSDPFQPVEMDQKNNITNFQPLVQPVSSSAHYVFTGVHIVDPKVLDYIPDGPSDTVKDIYPKLMAEGHTVRGFVSDAYWCECSTPRRYLEKSLEMLRRHQIDYRKSGSLSSLSHGVVAGQGVEISKNSVVEDSVLWNKVRVGKNSSLRNVIITAGVELAAETHLRNAIVTPLLGKSPDQGTESWFRENHLIWPL